MALMKMPCAVGSGGKAIEIAYQAFVSGVWGVNTLITEEKAIVATALNVELVGEVIGFTPISNQQMTIRAIKDCTIYYYDNISSTTNATSEHMSAGATKTTSSLSNYNQSIVYAVED